jgi:predicted site-specific integrase-resolvase
MKLSTVPCRVSAEELSVILGITDKTLKALARAGEIPCLKEKNKIYFDVNEIMERFKGLEGAAA